MTRYSIYLILPVLFLLSGCFFYYSGIYGSGRLITNYYQLSDFSGIKADDAIEVTVNYGEYYSVSLLCDDNILPYVTIYNDGYYLRAEMQSGFSFINATVELIITTPVLKDIYADGASRFQISGFSLCDSFRLTLTEASEARIYLTDAENLLVSMEDASFLEIHSVYPVKELNISCTDASNADLGEMLCSNGEISVDDASTLKVYMDGPLTGQVSGASTLFYRGSTIPGPILFSGSSGIVYY